MTSPLDECERTFETATLEWQGIEGLTEQSEVRLYFRIPLSVPPR